MHGKPRHRREIHTLDQKSVLQSKSIHENRRRAVTGNSHPDDVCHHPVCLICTQKTYLMQINTNKGMNIGVTTLYNLRYADATVLLAETEEDLQEILNEVNRIGKTFDVKMNAKNRGDRGQSAYGARPPLGFNFFTIIFLVIPEI